MEDEVPQAPPRSVEGNAELLPDLALEWLHTVIDTESTSAPPVAHLVETARRAAVDPGHGGGRSRVESADRAPTRLASRDPFDLATRYARGEVEPALWYREWHRRWRRFQLPDQLHRFQVRLSEAQRPADVYQTLTEHTVQMVGGYTCLLFPPQESGPLRPIPNPALRVDAGRITLSLPLAEAGLIDRERVLGQPDGPLADLAPLFSEERAVSLAHAPFGEGGVILVLERRSERVFEAEDWELLRLLSTQAAAALARVRLALQTDVLQHTHPGSALPDEVQLPSILEHAMRLSGRGEPVTLVGIHLDGVQVVEAEDGARAAARIRRTAAEILREMAGTLGIVVHRAEDEFLLLLPRLPAAGAQHLATRLARQLPERVRVRMRPVPTDAALNPAKLLSQLDGPAGPPARPATGTPVPV